MRNLITTLIVSVFMGISLISSAQEFINKDADRMIEGAKMVRQNETNHTISYIELNGNHVIASETKGDWLLKSLKMNNNFKMVVLKEDKDKLSNIHTKYQFYYKNIPIVHAEYIIHGTNTKVMSANGNYPVLPATIKTTPSITEALALEKALAWFKAKKFKSETTPVGKLCYIEFNGKVSLSYAFDIYSIVPLKREIVYVDALTGAIITSEKKLYGSEPIGTAVTKYNGTRAITTNLYNGSYRLRETARNIETYNLQTSTSASSAVDFTDADNYWNTTTNQDNAAYDIHYGTEVTYDYYLNTFGRKSVDNSGYKLMSYAHCDVSMANAYWDGDALYYGDGDYASTAFTSLDIIAHEFTHGLTQNTAALVYSGESGALNESFSDIMAVIIDFKTNPTTANYTFGEQQTSDKLGFRSMQDPKKFQNPNTYNGTYWDPYGEVHCNGTVQSYWFYLLTNGGNGTNDIGSAYTVNGIGMDKAAQIVYRTLTTYLTSSATYSDARFYSIKAATDLYGACSNEVVNVTNAWYAVGVGSFFSSKIVSNISASNTYACSTPATISFTNQSLNASSYKWDFGDATTSALANPTHTYTSAGTYSIKLISLGSAACNASDTMIKKNYITISNGVSTKAASCNPTRIYSTSETGITHVGLNTISNTSLAGTENYMDFSCTNQTSLIEGKKYNINVVLEPSAPSAHIKVWLDVNNDGLFNETTELLLDSTNLYGQITASVSIPAASIYDTPIRLRIGSDIAGNNLTTACTSTYYGQYEDYSVVLKKNVDRPIALFKSDSIANVAQSILFTDNSLNIPTSWEWSFPGGTPSTSTLRNPTVSYATNGVYNVKLIAHNAYGVDTIIKNACVNVSSSYIMCSQTSSNAVSGTLYDSGGATGSYNNSENCSFLISVPCASSIVLTCKSFSTESGYDYFKVYDGTSASAISLLNISGSSIPAPVTATSGNLYIVFTSDYSSTYSGFQFNWLANVSSTNPTIADFTISNDKPAFNTPVQFKDKSTEMPTTWNWNFGDGSTSIEQNPIHSYITAGTFNVQLIVHNCMHADTIIKKVVVQQAPQVTFNPTSYNVTIHSCNDTIIKHLVIKNTGLGMMVWNIDKVTEAYTDNFDPIISSTLWTETLNGTASGFCGYSSAPNGLYFNGDGARQATTKPLNVAGGGAISFDLKIGSLSSSGCEQADAGEDIVLEYSLNGTTWVNMNTYLAGTCAAFTTKTETIPLSARTTSTKFRWRQVSHSGSGCDNWVLDNVSINGGNSFVSSVQSQGTIIPGDSSIVDLVFSTQKLQAGVYTTNLPIHLNVPGLATATIPCTLTADGIASIGLSSSIMNFGNTIQGVVKTDSIKVINNGCSNLVISSLNCSLAQYTSSINKTTLAPRDSATLKIVFSPNAIANYNGILVIKSNIANDTITLKGVGTAQPILYISPTSINATVVHCNDIVQKQFYVKNTGAGTLVWSVAGNSFPGYTSSLSCTPTSGSLNFGDSTIVTLTINSQYINSGNYNTSITINHNIPAKAAVVIPCTFNVIGAPKINLNKTTVDFGKSLDGILKSSTVKIRNSGCAPLIISSLNSSLAVYTATVLPTTILPGDSGILTINFLPLAMVTYNGTLTIKSNVTDTIINLFGIGQGTPLIDVKPTSINQTITTCNGSVTVPLTISNTGDGDLDYSILTQSKTSGKIELLTLTYGVDLDEEYAHTLASLNSVYPNYNLTEINTTSATQLAAALVGKQVFLVSEQEAGDGSVFNALGPVMQDFANKGGTVIVCGTDNSTSVLNSGLVSGNYYSSDYTSDILNVIDVTHPITKGLSSTMYGENATFFYHFTNPDLVRLVTYQSYDVVSYRKVGLGNYIFLGFDFYQYNSDISKMLGNIFTNVVNGSATAPWMSFSDSLGTILPHDQKVVYVTLSAKDLANGTYTSSIIINSDAANTTQVTVPCTLNVVGSPKITANPSSVNFGNQVVYNQAQKSVYIKNTGCATLNISNVVLSLSEYSVSSINTSIAAGDSALLTIYFYPKTEGQFNGNVTISSNDNDLIINVYGVGMPSPLLTVTPSSINLMLKACDTLVQSFKVINSGKGILNYELQSFDWLYLKKVNGALTEGASDKIDYVVKPNGLAPGYYKTTISIVSNDPSKPISSLIANLLVTDQFCADFTYLITDFSQGLVSFKDASLNQPIKWFWDFGDGSTSTFENPYHMYAKHGIYTVKMIASTIDETDTIVKVLRLTSVGISEISNASNKLDVYPNPSTGNFTLAFDHVFSKDAIITIFDGIGQQLAFSKKDLIDSRTLQIELNDAAPGIYLVNIIEGDRTYLRKIVVQ